jgi:hypothetical protein
MKDVSLGEVQSQPITRIITKQTCLMTQSSIAFDYVGLRSLGRFSEKSRRARVRQESAVRGGVASRVILDDVAQQVGREVEAWTWEPAGWLDRVAGVFAHAVAASRKARLHITDQRAKGAPRGTAWPPAPTPPRQPDTTSGGR